MAYCGVCRHIRPYIRKYGKHPVTGAPLKNEDLITLNFHKNSDGKSFSRFIMSELSSHNFID